MEALETDEKFKKRVGSFVRARLDTANGRSKHTDPLFLTRNIAYFVLYDAQGREVRRVLDEAGESGLNTTPAGTNAHEAIRRDSVLAAMDEVLNATRKGAEGVPLLLRMLRDDRATVRADALWHVRRFGPKAAAAIPALVELLAAPKGAPKHKHLSAAALALGEMGRAAEPALPSLMRLAKSGSQAATRVLGNVDPDGTVVMPLLIELLDNRPNASIGASLAIQRLGPKAAAAVPSLTRLLENSAYNRAAQFYAVRAVGAIGVEAKPAVPALEALLTRERPKGTKVVWDVEAETKQALARIKTAQR